MIIGQCVLDSPPLTDEYVDWVVAQFERELDLETDFELLNGESVLVRPITTSDREMLADLYYRSSDESRRFRFLGPYSREHAAEEGVKYSSLVRNAYDFVAVTQRPDDAEEDWEPKVIAVAGYFVNLCAPDNKGHADVAIFVDEHYSQLELFKEQLFKEQGEELPDNPDELKQLKTLLRAEPGIAKHILLRSLLAAASDPQVDVIDFEIDSNNHRMIKLLRNVVADNQGILPYTITAHISEGVYYAQLRPTSSLMALAA